MTPLIVLAAGASSRLGRPKQLLMFEGEPLIRRAARIALEAGGGPVVVMLGNAERECRDALVGLSAEPAPAPDWRSGMGATIRAGVSYVTANYPDAEGVVILSCDQVRLTAAHLVKLTGAGARAASYYDGRRGIPAYFGRDDFAELARLDGDVGGRHLLAREGTVEIAFPGGGEDVDTPEDWERLTS